MNPKRKISNWNQRCPNQYKNLEGNYMLRALVQVEMRESKDFIPFVWYCRETDKLCGSYGREEECHILHEPEKPKRSGIVNYLSSMFSKRK